MVDRYRSLTVLAVNLSYLLLRPQPGLTLSPDFLHMEILYCRCSRAVPAYHFYTATARKRPLDIPSPLLPHSRERRSTLLGRE